VVGVLSGDRLLRGPMKDRPGLRRGRAGSAVQRRWRHGHVGQRGEDGQRRIGGLDGLRVDGDHRGIVKGSRSGVTRPSHGGGRVGRGRRHAGGRRRYDGRA